MNGLQIVGRRSSLFTRVALIFAEELELAYELVPIYDMTALDPQRYGDNPALKLPILRRNGSSVFGTVNICRTLVESTSSRAARIVWPEELRDDTSRNAQELVWHCMAAQVQLVMGTVVGKLPDDNVLFVKTRTGMENALAWLNEHLHEVLQALPRARDLSVFEVSLFCLLEHLAWRGPMQTDHGAALMRFAHRFGQRPAAQQTAYQFDAPPQA